MNLRSVGRIKLFTIKPITHAISIGTDAVLVKIPPALSLCVPGFSSSVNLAKDFAARNKRKYSLAVNPPRG